MNNKPIKNYKMEHVLLNYDGMINLSNEYAIGYEANIKRSKNKELTLTLAIELLLNIIAVFPSFSSLETFWKVFSIIILLALLIYFIISATKWHDAYNQTKTNPNKNLEELILEKAKENIRYTGIIRIVYTEKEELKYLTGQDYFLPHCNLSPEKPINQQNRNITESLQREFNIKTRDIVKITPVDNIVHYSIKPIHDTIQMNAYVFYDIKIKEEAKERLTEKNQNRKWESISNMRKVPSAISTNKDVIEILEKFPVPNDSFVNMLEDIRIIWNITNACNYNCAICATHDEKRSELTTKDKLTVLNSICTAKHLIKSLDFAGGDPLYTDENIPIIKSAIQQLGSEKVSITTTGEGISKTNEDTFRNIAKHCEITIDASHNNLQQSKEYQSISSFSRDESNYTENNIKQINIIREQAETLTINIPIIDDDLKPKEIEELVKQVSWVKNHTNGLNLNVCIIRLMPVGKVPYITTPEKYKKYNPTWVAQKIKTDIDNLGVECSYHCSLRILPELTEEPTENYCQMLENKIGIDCEGNVFACAWGGYVKINDPPTQNPFYLGNLTKVDLIRILTNKSKTNQGIDIFSEIENKNHRNYCSVVSFYMKKTLFKNNDPLSNNTDE